MKEPSCAEVAERLAWYVQGTLDAEEHAAVERHLGGCATCRGELDATRRVAWITSRHLLAGLIADYACGLDIDVADRRELERHVQLCPSCREELATALGRDGGAPASALPAQTSSSSQRWRYVALAATLTACVSAGFLLWRTKEQQVRVATGAALVELVPDSARTRSAADSATRLGAESATTLILETNLLADAPAYRVRLLTAEGRDLAVVTGLHADLHGEFALHLPPHAWPSGDHLLVLEASRGAVWQRIESYHLTISP